MVENIIDTHETVKPSKEFFLKCESLVYILMLTIAQSYNIRRIMKSS